VKCSSWKESPNLLPCYYSDLLNCIKRGIQSFSSGRIILQAFIFNIKTTTFVCSCPDVPPAVLQRTPPVEKHWGTGSEHRPHGLKEPVALASATREPRGFSRGSTSPRTHAVVVEKSALLTAEFCRMNDDRANGVQPHPAPD